jgi:hypothetical protein
MGEHRSTPPDPRQLSDLERRVRRWRDDNASPTGYGPGSMAIAVGQVYRWWDVQTLLEVIDSERAAPTLDETIAALAAVMGTSTQAVESALRAGMGITRDELDDMRRHPATTGEHPAVPECNRPAHADGHHGPECYGEPGTTDQREAHTEWARWLGADDNAITDSPEVFALLRDVADAEPVVDHKAPGHPRANECTMCGARSQPRTPVPHLISCPWVRVTHLVGVKPDA